MEVRLLIERDLISAKALWKQAFDDSDAFIDTYFKNKILPGNSIGLFDGGLISVVHMLPFRIRIMGKDLPTAYIAGAATAAAHRGAGHMRTLLFESLKLMRTRGIMMTHLYPFKHSFYEKFGWATYTYVRKITATRPRMHTAAHVVGTADAQLLAPLYTAMMQGCDGYVVRGPREWRWRLEELHSDGGRVIVLMKDTVPAAYMMVYETNGKAEAIETVYTDEADAAALADHLLMQGAKQVRYNLAAQGEAHGMARVIDAEALLKEFGAQALLKHVRIIDDFAPWNSIGPPSAPEITAAQLAQLVHRGTALHGIYEKKEHLVKKCANIFFTPRKTCIFEEY